MQNEEQLNKLFNLAKEQEVLLNSDEIQALMNTRLVKKPTDRYQKFKPFKIKAMTISTLLIGIAATIVFYTNSNPKTFKKPPSKIAKTTIEPLKKSLPEIEETKQLTISAPEIAYTIKPQTTADDTGKKKKVIVEQKTLISDEEIIVDKKPDKKNKDVEINFMVKNIELNGSNESDSKNKIPLGFEKETFVHLTKEELKKLGIYIKDGVFMYEMANTKDGDIKAFWGGKDGRLSRSTSNKKLFTGDNPRIAFISTQNGKYRDGAGYMYTSEEAQKEAPKLLPIWLEDPKSENEKVFVAWFEMNSKLIDLLPVVVQKNLKDNKDFYKHSLPEQKEIIYKFKIDSITPHKNASLIAIDSNQLVIPSKSLLKNLGVKSTNPLKYHRRYNGRNLKITIKGLYIDIINNYNGNNEGGKELKNIFPIFLTLYSPKFQSAFEPDYFSMPIGGTKINVRQYFETKKYGLIGFKIKSGNVDYLLWYEPTEALLKELPETDRKKIEDYLSSNKGILDNIELNTNLPEEKSFEEVANGSANNSAAIKTVTLNETQLEKLAIKVENRKIVHKIYLGQDKGKPSALQIIYDKSGSISTYPVKFENYDSASYMYPVMITDDVGQYARTNFNAGYDLEKISSYNLIPVIVKSGEEYTTMDKLTKKARPDIIFWYEPTEKFLKILDTKTATEIRNDIVALTCNRSKITFTTDSTCDGKSVVSCNYFEACQNTKSKAITKYSIFPNPAKDNFNLKLDLKEECSVVVYMFALNGAEVKQFPIGKIKQGISQKELSSDGITPGLYLLRITTDKGDIFNERILIKE
jgi:hypothetical protein